VPRDAKSQWLLHMCEQLVKTHLFGSGEITDFVQKADDLQRALGGPFHCRQDDCHKIYNQHSQRIKYEYYYISGFISRTFYHCTNI
jgi:hypothetical protein